jgi:hypothetical protein
MVGEPASGATSMKLISPPQSGRVGDVVYVISRYGQIARKYVPPRNPRTPAQQRNRSNFGAISSQWRALSPEQRAAWCLAAAAAQYTLSPMGRRVALNGYNYFVKVNSRRAHLGLSQFDSPPSAPGQYTLVQGAAPVSTGVACVQHFPFLGLLPAPVDGWTDITALYVARYGVPTVGQAIFIRTCQHIDGWTDVPKLANAVVPAPAR